MDPTTQQIKPLPPVYFDVGAFCKKVGADCKAFCWDFICPCFLAAFDRANKKFKDMKGLPLPGENELRSSLVKMNFVPYVVKCLLLGEVGPFGS